MPIDAPRLWQQVALGEDTDLELKEARFQGDRVSGPRRDDLADELAAFANARGGRLVLGVSDDRQPQSLDPAQLDALASLVNEICSGTVKPPLDFSVFRVQAPGPGPGGALVVETPESATVHRSPGGYFAGGETRSARWTRRKSTGCRWRAGSPTPRPPTPGSSRSSGINSLQPALWRQYASSRADETAEITLSKLKLLKDGTVRFGPRSAACCWPRRTLARGCRTPGSRRCATAATDGRRPADRRARDIAGPLDRQIRCGFAKWRAARACSTTDTLFDLVNVNAGLAHPIVLPAGRR